MMIIDDVIMQPTYKVFYIACSSLNRLPDSLLGTDANILEVPKIRGNAITRRSAGNEIYHSGKTLCSRIGEETFRLVATVLISNGKKHVHALTLH